MKGYIEKMKQQKMDLITLFKFRKSGQISHESKKNTNTLKLSCYTAQVFLVPVTLKMTKRDYSSIEQRKL
jgi:accessory gene regulator protein AgrB